MTNTPTSEKKFVLNSPNNRKLGTGIHSFSLPAGPASCPGRTKVCSSVCYAQRGFFSFPAMHRTLAAAMKQTKAKNFVARTVEEIHRRGIRVVRIHVAGDFYLHKGKNPDQYIRRWIEIIKSCPNVKFFGYTRSWRIQKLVPALRALAKLPNMVLWLSCDRDAPKPVRIAHTRVAYMLSDPDGEQSIPSTSNLVFRTMDRHLVRKKIDGVQVCPVENGIKLDSPVTCTTCKLCWDSSTPVLTQLSLAGRAQQTT